MFRRFLAFVERVGNKLPSPATLFLILALGVLFLSAVAASLGWAAIHPVSGASIRAVSLLNMAGLRRILTTTVSNFTGFAPLGTVLVAMLGIAVAEGSGLVAAALKLVLVRKPSWLLSATVVLAGTLSHVGGDVGFVLVIPLAGAAFHAAGRNPLAGLAAAFAGVSGGFSANFLLGTLDPLLAGITQEAARIIAPGYAVNALANYYFMAASAGVIVALGTIVTERITVARFGAYAGEASTEGPEGLSAAERRGLVWAGIVLTLLTLTIVWLTVPAGAPLRDPETGSLIQSPLISGIVTVIFIAGVLCGLAFGLGAKTVKSDADAVEAMSKAMATMAPYMVMAFFAAQFIAFFNATNLGLIAAVRGASVLRDSGLGDGPIIVLMIAFAALIDLVIASASAKWAIMAPVFVPMLMLLGHSPELVQATYRIGDSFANIITPLMPYFPLVVSYFQRYEKKAGVGTVIAAMIPYSIAFAIAWTVLLFVWIGLGLPLGPGAPLTFGR